MSTITKERLQRLIRAIDSGSYDEEEIVGWVNSDEIMELARIALASLEADPVGYMNRFTGRVFTLEEQPGADTDAQVYVPVYTAPPAPVSVLDDVSGPLAHAYKELTPTFMRNHIGVFERYGIYPDGLAGIQAMRIALDGMNRRAAMLHGAEPVTTAYKLPEGWVACSERMPEDEQEVLTRNKMGHCFVSFFDEHSGLFFDRIDVAAACCIEHILVTHWMPLPAAPEQEA